MRTRDEKIPVGVLGATGTIGQRFVERLAEHPWFEITALAASERSAGRPYGEASRWRLSSALPDAVASRSVSAVTDDLPCRAVCPEIRCVNTTPMLCLRDIHEDEVVEAAVRMLESRASRRGTIAMRRI